MTSTEAHDETCTKLTGHWALGTISGLVACMLMCSGCNDKKNTTPEEGSSDMVQRFTTTWNGPDADEMLPNGQTPLQWLKTHNDADRDVLELYIEAIPSLLTGCYATDMQWESADGVDRFRFLRPKSQDNPNCATFVEVKSQHAGAPKPLYRCEFQDAELHASSFSLEQGDVRWHDQDGTLNEILEDHCTSIASGSPLDGMCTQHLSCALSASCAFYLDKSDQESDYGLCKEAANPDDALRYALETEASIPYHDLDWPWTVHTTLYGETDTAEAWKRYWNTVVDQAKYLYLDWTDANDVRFALYRSGPRLTEPDSDPTGTRIWFSDETDQEFSVCDLPPDTPDTFSLEGLAFDETGAPLDLSPWWKSVRTQCTIENMEDAFQEGASCPAIEDSPFVCANGATCHATWPSDSPQMGSCGTE